MVAVGLLASSIAYAQSVGDSGGYCTFSIPDDTTMPSACGEVTVRGVVAFDAEDADCAAITDDTQSALALVLRHYFNGPTVTEFEGSDPVAVQETELSEIIANELRLAAPVTVRFQELRID